MRTAAVTVIASVLFLVASGCSNIVDESDIPVVTLPGSASGVEDAAATTAVGGLDPNAPLTLGAVTLDPCDDLTGAWCGSIEVPVIHSDPDSDTLTVGFELYPRRTTTAPSAGTIAAIEGGPGYSSTGARDAYLALFDPVLDDHDLLLVDTRGTGRSTPVDCTALQSGDPTIAAVNECAATLGAARDEYGAAAAADDLGAVMDALGAGHIDLYGDSYGTVIAQAFAARHGDKLRSLVLDSALPVVGADPFHADRIPAALVAFDRVCERDTTCAARDEPSSARIAALVASVRQTPVAADVTDADGQTVEVTADAASVLTLVLSAATDWTVYRELDAAAGAWLTGDQAPLLRLLSHDPVLVSDDSLAVYSAGVGIAATCSDYPLVFDPAEPTAARLSAIEAAISAQARELPATFGPWTPDEWRASTANELEECAMWPASDDDDPPAGPNPRFPDVPTLVLAGDLDTLTPPSESASTAALFPEASFVLVTNSGHVTALDDGWGCASTIVAEFVDARAPVDTSCASSIPPIRPVERFVRQAADAAEATAQPGDASTPLDRQITTLAVAQVGDALAQWAVMTGVDGSGLRGGTFAISDGDGDIVSFVFEGAKFSDDVAVDGTATWDRASGQVEADLEVTAPGAGGSLSVAWDDSAPHAVAMARGALEGRPVSVTLPAP
jgi:pimeloyl-ACP methyl ester carboxylesterase